MLSAVILSAVAPFNHILCRISMELSMTGIQKQIAKIFLPYLAIASDVSLYDTTSHRLIV
jgi:hypothetical protein